jgi:2'-5' RNA ligase
LIYIVNCQLRNGFNEYQKSLVDEICKKFDLKITQEENLPAHFTLKYWFDTKNISDIERIFEQFVQMHKKFPVKAGGFDSFSPKVIFINLELSNEAKKNFSDLISELKKVSWMPWDKYDAENLHFHSTIAEECDEKFDAVWNFIQSKEPQYFDCWFDNITIMKQVGGTKYFGKWQIHKSFEIR